MLFRSARGQAYLTRRSPTFRAHQADGRGVPRPYRSLALAFTIIVTGCAGPGPAQTSTGQTGSQQPARTKVLTVAITTDVAALGVIGEGTTGGGWGTIADLHSSGLITTDVSSTSYVGRLAERVPTVEDTSVSIRPDGQMRVAYTLRKGITWHDGAPFTAEDMAFSFKLLSDPYVTNSFNDVVKLMSSVEAPDEGTVVVTFKQPYYLGNALVNRKLWPQPRHLLNEAHERYLASGNTD